MRLALRPFPPSSDQLAPSNYRSRSSLLAGNGAMVRTSTDSGEKMVKQR
jgi:hypothetical protein